MTGEPVVLVDPLCLCGRPHPCELHGEWTGTPPTLHMKSVEVPDDLRDLLATLAELLDVYEHPSAKGA